IRRREARKRKNHDPKPHLPGFIHRDERAVAIFHDVEQQGPGREFPDRARGFVLGLEALEEADVGAPVAGGLEPGDALLEAELLVGVGAGDELDVGLGGVDGGAGGADAREEDVVRDDFFAREVAAAFGEELVFDVEGGDVGADVLVDGLVDGDGAWVVG
ncbi:MAG: hypothetical protein Q9216_006428, partial [Gyalolechia sp. 2 TL-2023]